MSFLNPENLYLLLVCMALFAFTFKQNIQINQVFSKEILEKLTIKGDGFSTKNKNRLLIFALAFFIIALARPVSNQQNITVKQKIIPVVVALDVSRSMKLQDIRPSRLKLAQKKLNYIVKHLQNSAIGIVLYAKDAYIASPITSDLVSLEYISKHLNTDILYDDGSNLALAMEASLSMLKNFKEKNLIVLSDGSQTPYKKEQIFAKNNNFNIYSIGLATKAGSAIMQKNDKTKYILDENGKIVILNLTTHLRDLSIQSGGGYIDFTLDDNDIEQILAMILKRSAKMQTQNIKHKVYTELFYYFIFFGLLLIFLSFYSLKKIKIGRISKINVLFVVILSNFWLSSGDLYAFDLFKLKQAKQFYDEKEYKKACKIYKNFAKNNNGYYNYANCLYKMGKYKEAIVEYKKIKDVNFDGLKHKVYHNLGNSFARLNLFKKSVENYKKSINLMPDDETSKNLEIIQSILDKREKKKQKSDKNSKKQAKNKKKTDKNNKKQQKSGKNKQKDKKNISNMEEKKWIRSLHNNDLKIMLHKFKTQKGTQKNAKPW